MFSWHAHNLYKESCTQNLESEYEREFFSDAMPFCLAPPTITLHLCSSRYYPSSLLFCLFLSLLPFIFALLFAPLAITLHLCSSRYYPSSLLLSLFTLHLCSFVYSSRYYPLSSLSSLSSHCCYSSLSSLLQLPLALFCRRFFISITSLPFPLHFNLHIHVYSRKTFGEGKTCD